MKTNKNEKLGEKVCRETYDGSRWRLPIIIEFVNRKDQPARVQSPTGSVEVNPEAANRLN